MSDLKKIVNVILGSNVIINDFVNLYGCTIGDNTKIGTFVEIQSGANIGRNCKIQSHTFICEGVTIQDGVFVGHNVSFINDRYPAAVNKEGLLKSSSDWTLEHVVVENGAVIGTGATIMCGVNIGSNSLVGAGSLVLNDVPPNSVVAGVPAKIIKRKDDINEN